MGKYTAAEFITLIEERFASNKITSAERKTLLRDMSSLLENIEGNNIVAISSISSKLKFHTTVYLREYFQSGKIEHEEWYLNSKVHRGGGKPAIIQYYENGQITYEERWVNNKLHQDGDKPAQVYYYENGKIGSEEWYLNGKRHRDGDKPAYIYYDENGQVKVEEWWFDGKKQNKI